MNAGETFAYAALALGAILLLFASQLQAIAILSIILAFLAYLFYAWGNIYVPLLTAGQRDIKVPYDFEINASEDAVIKQVGEDYAATVFLSMDVYETMTNKSDEEMHDYAQHFERSIASLKDPIKISAVIYEKDMGKYIHAIDERKAAVEDMIAQERQKKKTDEMKIEVLEREKLMWERRLDSLYKSSEKPRAVTYIISTTAKGATKDAAVSAAKVRANEIKATFSGSMSLRIDEMTHNRLKSCFEWEFMAPEW